MTGRTAEVLLTTALLLAPVTAATQERVEFWGGFSGIVTSASGSLTSTYAPPLVAGTAVTSSAGQTLVLDGTHGWGWQAGVNVFPTKHVGAQIFFDRGRVDLGGANGPYSTSLTWISRQPPDYQPRTLTTAASTPWPDTSGSLSQSTVGLNAILRTATTHRVSASVSGGFSYYRITASAQPLGYTEYHLGGHSTLFSDEMHLLWDTESTGAVGFNAGGDLSVALSRQLSAVVGYRYLGARAVDLPVRLTAVTNPDQVAFSETIDTIATRMAVPPAHVSIASSRVIVGLKLTR